MGILKRNKSTKKDVTPTPAGESKKTRSAKKNAPSSVVGPEGYKRILLGAHVSEKAAGVESNGVYTFRVTGKATKGDIAHALFARYGVKPVSIRVMNVEGKRVQFGRTQGKRSDWKKAIVTLPEGAHIDIHSGI